jgi:hypothetical protein
VNEHLPERTPDPVDEALRLRASDADRERVAALLRDAFVEGRLSPVEHEERLAGVYRATTYGELVPLLHDLPVPPGALTLPGAGAPAVVPQRPVAPRPGTGLVVDPSRAATAQTSLVAVFSGVERKGRWVLPPSLNVVTIMGGAELDLREAVLTSQETVINVVAIMGGLAVKVPSSVAVRLEVFGFMGGTSGPSDGDDEPGMPVVRFTGAAIMGGVDVKRTDDRPDGRRRELRD